MAAKKKPAKKKAPKRKAVKAVVRRKVTRKAPARKKAPLKKTAAKKKQAVSKPAKNVIGTVTHYFPHVNAAVIKLKAALAVGDIVKIKGHTTDFTQTISSMQIDHAPIDTAKKGDEIGLLVDSRVRQHDAVIKP